MKSSSFVLFRFFLSGKSIISYLIFENWLEEAERKYTEIYLSLLKYTQIISKSQNILWIFIVLSQGFAPEHFVNTYVILYYFVFGEVLVSIFLFCYIFVFCSLCPLCHNRFFRIGFLFSERKRYERLLNVRKHHFRNRISFNCS